MVKIIWDIIEAVNMHVVYCISQRHSKSQLCGFTLLNADMISKVVKIQDLRHNLDLTRLKVVIGKDLAGVEKYKHCLEALD